MVDRPRRAFVCGHPISHSRSPLIHGYWLKTLGIDGSYDRVDVAPLDFPDFLKGIETGGYIGGNVTIPHKEAAFHSVAKRDADADAIGAVNTVWIEDNVVCGGNTDAYGFAANLDEHAPQWTDGKVAVVFGAGGAARAVIHALKLRGYRDIRVANRTSSRVDDLATRFGQGLSGHAWDDKAELFDDADLLVNASSLGMKGAPELAADLSRLPAHAIVTDLVYVPVETPLLKEAKQRGLAAVDGLGMLLHQAAPGFERWFGRRPGVTGDLRDLVMSDVEKPR